MTEYQNSIEYIQNCTDVQLAVVKAEQAKLFDLQRLLSLELSKVGRVPTKIGRDMYHDIINVTLAQYNETLEALRSKKRDTPYPDIVRHIAILTDDNNKISKRMGALINRDHSTMSTALRTGYDKLNDRFGQYENFCYNHGEIITALRELG